MSSRPPLPPNPWQRGSVARAVQNAYIKSRLAGINNSPKLAADLDATIEILQNSPLLPQLKKAPEQTLLETYMRLQRALQNAALTINFNSVSWFKSENHYDSYAQMYERGGTTGNVFLKGDKNNPVDIRVAADDKATFPSQWMKTGMPSQGQQINLPAVQLPQRGLAPLSRQAMDRRVLDKMAPKGLMPVTDPYNPSAAPNTFHVTNAQFDPKTKQVFAAVNYGHRPHGSTTPRYGWSYFTLKDHFKQSAMYYAGDTFFSLMGVRNSADDQLSYQWLGLLLSRTASHPKLKQLGDDIIRACVVNQRLGDTDESNCEFLIVEAHLFQPLQFSTGIQEMCVSARDITDPKNPGQVRQFEDVRINARKFASKHGIRIVFIE